MGEKRLTAPQRVLLEELGARPLAVSECYAPAVRLVLLGLAEWQEGPISTKLVLLPAGRAALQGSGPTNSNLEDER